MKWRRPLTEWALLAASAVLISASWVLLRFCSVQWLDRVLSTKRHSPTRDQKESIARIVKAVTSASSVAPGAACLTQAFAAKALLAIASCPSEVRIGVARNQEQGLKAHAWLEAGGAIVMGESASPERFQELPWKRDSMTP